MVWWYERKPNGESMIHKKAHYMGADAKKKGKKEKGKKKEIKSQEAIIKQALNPLFMYALNHNHHHRYP